MTTLQQFSLTTVTGPKWFPVLLIAFGYVPPQGRPRMIEQLEVEADLTQTLCRISTEDERGQRNYLGGDQTLLLSPGQTELLRQRIVDYPFWNPLLSDAVAETYRWLGTDGKDAST